MSYADSFKRALLNKRDDYDPNDGPHSVTIVDASAFEGNDGREWMKVTLEINSGPSEVGRQFDDFGPAGDHSPVGFSIMLDKLSAYGYSPDPDNPPADVFVFGDQLHDQLIGRTADITVRHKDGFRNITVQGSRSATPESDIPTDDGPKGFAERAGITASTASNNGSDDEDIPF